MANADLCFYISLSKPELASSKLLRDSQREVGAAQGAEGINHLTGPRTHGRERGQQCDKAACNSMNEP